MTWSRAALGGVALGSLAVAYVTAVRPVFVLAYTLLALIVLSWVWSWRVARSVALTRTFEMSRPQVGSDYLERLTLARHTVWPAPMITLSDGGNVPGAAAVRVLGLSWSRAASWRAHGRFLRRGWHVFGPARATVSDPFGMFPREVEFADVERVLVLPRIVRLLGVGEGGDRYPGEGSGQGAWREYPPESVGVREHQPGEALGRVHWPTTLRVGRLMVRQFDQPFASDVWIVLDLEAGSNWGAEEHSTLEYGVTLAASLASEFISRGRRVGLLASDRACSVVEPQGGVRHLVELMERLALVEADGDRPLAEVLSWRRWQGAGEGLAVVTASSAPEWVSLLVERARRGSAPLVFHLDAPSFDPRGRSVLLPADLSVDVRTIRCGDDLERSSGRRGVEPIAV